MTERVIWEREIEHERILVRTARFQKMFAALAVVLLVATLILGGITNALGMVVLLAIIGVSWGMTVRLQNLNDAANPRLVVDRGRIVLGSREVIIEDVKRFSTLATVIQPTPVGTIGEIQLCKVVFRMDMPGSRSQPDLVEFGWPNMAPEGVISLKEALDPVLPGKWVEPEDLLDPNERPEEPSGRRGKRKRR